MGWFLEWWQEIGLTGQIMACTAIPTSIILIMQAIMMLVGAGFGGDSDGFDSDGADAGVDGFDADAADAGFDGFDADASDVGFDGFDADASDVGFDGFDMDAAGAGVDGFDSDISDIDGGSLMDSHIIHGAHGHGADTLRIFTVRGIIAFFAIGGWAGLAAVTSGVPAIWSVQIALLSGVAAMIVASVVIKFALRMQSSGNIDLKNAVAQTAEVYITIPPSRTNTGKVMMLLQERFVEIDAVTDSTESIKSNTIVEIVGLRDKDCLIVRPISEGTAN